MIQILTLIRFAFPFLLLTAFFCLYKKEYGFMKRFMWKMPMFQSARNLYAYLVVLMLIFINWCCHVTAPNLSVVVSTLLTLVLLNRKIAESTFHLLHERKKLWFATLLLSMVCYALPYMNSMSLFLFTVSVAAVFYPPPATGTVSYPLAQHSKIKMTQITHHPNQQTPEADRCRGVDRSLLEFLKPKAEERYSKLEAYCDLLSKASSGAYQSPGTDGALQLLPGQFVATISELARQWQWQRATVRQFISGLTKLGQLSVEPYSKSFIFSVNLEQRLSLLIESPDDILDFCAMQFIRFIKGRSTAEDVADSYSRYYDLKMNMAKQEGYGGIPARRVLNQQAQVFDSLAVSILRYLNQEKEQPEELFDSVSLLFGKGHVWDWHKVIDSLGILAKAISGNTKPSYMDEVATRYSKAEIVLLDCIFEHYISGSASHYYVNPPRPLIEAREPSEKVAPAESSDD